MSAKPSLDISSDLLATGKATYRRALGVPPRARLWLGLLTLLSAVFAAPALGLSTDRDQPVSITADWAEADDSKRIAVYKGKVVIIQGSLRISGDVVTMYFDKEQELERMIAVGRLARFRQKPDGEPNYQLARAKRIQYNLGTDTMILTGSASLSKGGDQIQADRIVYDTLNSRIKGERLVTADEPKRSGRVQITLNPKKRKQ